MTAAQTRRNPHNNAEAFLFLANGASKMLHVACQDSDAATVIFRDGAMWGPACGVQIRDVSGAVELVTEMPSDFKWCSRKACRTFFSRVV